MRGKKKGNFHILFFQATPGYAAAPVAAVIAVDTRVHALFLRQFLAITRAIVEAHGGRAGAASAQGRTRFSLTFPHPAGAS